MGGRGWLWQSGRCLAIRNLTRLQQHPTAGSAQPSVHDGLQLQCVLCGCDAEVVVAFPAWRVVPRIFRGLPNCGVAVLAAQSHGRLFNQFQIAEEGSRLFASAQVISALPGNEFSTD